MSVRRAMECCHCLPPPAICQCEELWNAVTAFHHQHAHRHQISAHSLHTQFSSSMVFSNSISGCNSGKITNTQLSRLKHEHPIADHIGISAAVASPRFQPVEKCSSCLNIFFFSFYFTFFIHRQIICTLYVDLYLSAL